MSACATSASKAGETVLVSAAAGAVGSIAAQIAKILGAKVIGLAGGPAKAAFLTGALGLDGAIDYKNEDVAARLKALGPEGIDVFPAALRKLFEGGNTGKMLVKP